MPDIMTLRGVAISQYRSIGKFANAIGWTRNKASRIINGVQAPSVDDVEKMAICLHIDTQEVFMQIFFGSLSTKWTKI